MNATTIRFTGLASGIDTVSIIENLMKLERRPIQRLQAERTALTTRHAAMNELGGLLRAAGAAARDLHSPTALLATGATSTNSQVAHATAGAGAPHGTYNLTVHSLAKAHTLASDVGVALTAGTELHIDAAGESRSVQVHAGDTLMSFAARINATDGIGATASVLDGRLILTARNSGADAALTVTGDAAADLNLTTTQAGEDVAVEVNGLMIARPTNTISDAIAATTLTLTGVGAAVVNVGLDADAATAEARGFVDAYNTLMTNLRASTAYDASTGAAGTFQGDQTITHIARQLRTIATSAVATGDGAHQTLASVGITAGRDGLLTLDEGTFAAALRSNPDGVRALFAHDDGDADGGGIARRLSAFADDIATHAIGARTFSYTVAIDRLDRKVVDMEHSMTMREQTMRAQWQAMERAVSHLHGQGSFLAAYLNHLV